MKISYILNSPLPTTKAHGLQVMKMCEAFTKNNVECELIIPQRKVDSTINVSDSFEFYGIKKKFKLTKLYSWNLIYWQQIPVIGKFFFWIQQVSFGLAVRKYLAGQTDAVIYSRDPFSLYFLHHSSLPLFWEAHTFPTKIDGPLYKTILARIDGLVVITQKLADYFSEYYHQPILVAHDAVDIEEFNIAISRTEARQQLSLPIDKKLALYVGNIYEWKGSKTLLECVDYLDSDITLIVVGGTEDNVERAKALVSAEQLAKIMIIPFVSHQQIPSYLKAADVLLLTGNDKDARALYYTSPLKLFEYMASGRPIVAQNLPAIAEILNSQCAFLVDPGSACQLAGGIRQALSNAAVSALIAGNAYKKVQANSWTARAGGICQYLSQQTAVSV